MVRNAILGISFGTVAVLTAFAFHSEGRVWGFNHWAYWVRLTPWLLAAACGLILGIAGFAPRRLLSGKPLAADSKARGGAWLEIAALAVLFGLAFFAGRARTHFLGDGYQTISALASVPPEVKATAPLLRLVLPSVRGLFGENLEAASLRAYQFLSIGSGVLFVVAVAFFARLFFVERVDRLLFVASCATAGFALLFFGYVENYAPLIVLTAITFLTGLAALEGKIARAWLIPPAFLMMWGHVLGVLVLPAASFAFLSSRATSRWFRSHLLFSWMGLFAVVVAAMFAIGRWTASDPRIQVAFLPLTSKWFVHEGYTLFSRHHLMDLANLIFLLFPGCLVCVAWAVSSRTRLPLRSTVGVFSLLFAGALGSAVFFLSPELGMPRDWDLFAFAAVPLVILASLWMLRDPAPEGRLALICSIVLGIAVLGARVAEGRFDDVAIRRFRDYLALDKAKGRNGYFHLVQYYRRKGAEDQAQQELAQWENSYPERAMMRTADEHFRNQHATQAIQLCREALALNPVNNEAYMILGEAHLLLREYAPARLASWRAYALSADRLRCSYNLGLAEAGLGNFDEAERWLRQALDLAPQSFKVNLNYALVSRELGDFDRSEEYFDRAARCEGANPELIAEARRLQPTAP